MSVLINSNELRIGNYVQVLGIYKDSYKKAGVVQCDAELILLCDINKIALIPIPITSAMLHEFGFEMTRVEDTEDGYFNVIAGYKNWELKDKNLCFSRGQNDELETPFKCIYVHQLQNACFVLSSGNELNMNYDQRTS